MATHQAIGFNTTVDLTQINPYQMNSVDTNQPIDYQVLVKVQAVAVNPVDLKMQTTYQGNEFRILGFDAVGEILAVGPLVTNFEIGDKVFYAGRQLSAGANQEKQLVDSRLIAKAPKKLNNDEIAAMPLTSITASEILVESFGLKIEKDSASGKKILVINGAGGVGSVLIQLAKYMGMMVVATASRPETVDWVTQMGADLVINHRLDLNQELARINVDKFDDIALLHDTDKYLPLAVERIKPFGKISAIVEGREPLNINPLKNIGAQFTWVFMFAKGNFKIDMDKQGAYLAKIANLLDSGVIKSTISKTYQGFSTKNLYLASQDVATQKMLGKVVVNFEKEG